VTVIEEAQFMTAPDDPGFLTEDEPDQTESDLYKSNLYDEPEAGWVEEEEIDGYLSNQQSQLPRSKNGGNKSKKSKPRNASSGLKKRSLKKSRELDMPPTPLGCEWRETDGGWNLFRCWHEKDEVLGGRYKKERYVGFLSREAWQVMKQYEYETFISIIGQRFRRHSGR